MNWEQWILTGCTVLNVLSIPINVWAHHKGKKREARLKALHLPSDIVLSIDAQSVQLSMMTDELRHLNVFMRQAWGNPEDIS